MAGLDLTNLTTVYAASDDVQTHAPRAPYQTLHIRTVDAILIAVGEDPTADSFLLPAQSVCNFHVEIDEDLRFMAAAGGTGEVRITALATSADGSESSAPSVSLGDVSFDTAGLATSALQTSTKASIDGISTKLSAPLQTHPTSANPTEHVGTITTGGTAQVLMAANPARQGWSFQNQSDGDLRIRARGAAGTLDADADTGLILPAGAYFEPPVISTQAYSIFGATTGQAFYALEW